VTPERVENRTQVDILNSYQVAKKCKVTCFSKPLNSVDFACIWTFMVFYNVSVAVENDSVMTIRVIILMDLHVLVFGLFILWLVISSFLQHQVKIK